MRLNLLSVLALTPAIYRATPVAGAETLLDLNDVLSANIDGVEDAPEFVTPPDGSYRLSIKDSKAEKYKTTDKESGNEVEKTRLKIIYQVEATKELADAEELPVANGSLFSEQFMTNPQGLSYFKRQAKNVLGEEMIKGVTIGDILKELPNGHSFDADVRVKITSGRDAQGKQKNFSNVQVRIKAGTDQDPAL